MPRLPPIMLLALLAAAPAAGQSYSLTGARPSDAWRIPHEAPAPLKEIRFTLPASDYVEPDGSLGRQRGIIAGIEVAPQAVVGIGLFDRLAKRPAQPPDPASDNGQRRSRKAAIGMSLRF